MRVYLSAAVHQAKQTNNIILYFKLYVNTANFNSVLSIFFKMIKQGIMLNHFHFYITGEGEEEEEKEGLWKWI